MPISIENNLKPDEVSNVNPKIIHYIPCQIDGDGEANVKKYFEPYITTNENGILESSLRGHPLRGSHMKLPTGHSGWHITEARQGLQESTRTLRVAQSFKNITYWNWDQNPSANDGLQRAFDWIDIADALHSTSS